MNKQLNDKELFSLVKELMKVLRLLQNDTIFCEGITFSQFSILDLVAEKGNLELSELHKLLVVEKSTTTRLVSPLVGQKLLVRTESTRDSRAITLKITRHGEEVHRKVWNSISCFMDNMIKHIPEERKEAVFDSLKIFIKACGN